jgi:hypothetical protein
MSPRNKLLLLHLQNTAYYSGIGENLEQKEMNRLIWRLSLFMTVLQSVTMYLMGTAGPISEHYIWLQKP